LPWAEWQHHRSTISVQIANFRQANPFLHPNVRDYIVDLIYPVRPGNSGCLGRTTIRVEKSLPIFLIGPGPSFFPPYRHADPDRIAQPHAPLYQVNAPDQPKLKRAELQRMQASWKNKCPSCEAPPNPLVKAVGLLKTIIGGFPRRNPASLPVEAWSPSIYFFYSRKPPFESKD